MAVLKVALAVGTWIVTVLDSSETTPVGSTLLGSVDFNDYDEEGIPDSRVLFQVVRDLLYKNGVQDTQKCKIIYPKHYPLPLREFQIKAGFKSTANGFFLDQGLDAGSIAKQPTPITDLQEVSQVGTNDLQLIFKGNIATSLTGYKLKINGTLYSLNSVSYDNTTKLTTAIFESNNTTVIQTGRTYDMEIVSDTPYDTLPPLPDGYAFLVRSTGEYLVNDAGDFLIKEID